MPTQLTQNTTELQSILDAVNALPEAGNFDVDVTLNDDETQSLLITDEKGEVDIDTEKNISSVTYNGVEVPLGAGAPKIFGDGSDGVGLFSSNTTWLADTEDTGMIVKNFESLTISEGVTVSAGNRNCGMIVRVKGDCTIAGSLVNKMSPKTLLDSDGVKFSDYPVTLLISKAGDGGSGGRGATADGKYAQSYGGAGMTGRFYGGGYSGGAGGGGGLTGGSNSYGGNGGSAESITTATSNIFIGGAGGNASAWYGKAGTNGGGGGGGIHGVTTAHGGAGGSGAGSSGGDGVTTSGSGAGGGGAGAYGGGVIILFVGGKLTITGTIDCSGGNGGAGGSGSAGGGGGGGAGGGRIFICYKKTISNTGVLNVNGGSGGVVGSSNYTNYAAATAGSAGTIGTTTVKTYEQYMEEDVA